jgi:hypothetical protein
MQFKQLQICKWVSIVAGMIGGASTAAGQSYINLSTPGFLIDSGPYPIARPLTLGVPYGQPYRLFLPGFVECRVGTPDGQVVISTSYQTPTELTGPSPGTVPRYGDGNGDGLIDDTDINLLCAAFGLSDEDPGFSANLDLDSDGFITLADHEKLLWLRSRSPLARQTFWLMRELPVVYLPIDIYPGEGQIRVEAPSPVGILPDVYLRQIATRHSQYFRYGTVFFLGDAFTAVHAPAYGPMARTAETRIRLKGRFQPNTGPSTPEMVIELPSSQTPPFITGGLPNPGGLYLDPKQIIRRIPGFTPLSIAPGSLAAGSELTVWLGGTGSTTRLKYPLRREFGESYTATTSIDLFPPQWFKAVYDTPDSTLPSRATWCGEMVDRAANPTVPRGLKYHDFALLPLAEQFGTASKVPQDLPSQERWSHYVFNYFLVISRLLPGQTYEPVRNVEIVSLRSDGTELARLSNVPTYFVTTYPDGTSRRILEHAFGDLGFDMWSNILEYQFGPEPLVFTDIDPPANGFPGVRMLKVEPGGTVLVLPGGEGW